jgi:Spy/CpxP family protein refolding chaperone
MKLSRFLKITLLAALSLSLMAATVHSAEKPRSVAAPTARTPQDLANEALARWKTTLKITDAQAPRFESIMIDSYRKMAQAKASAAGDKAKLNDSVFAVFKEREAALVAVLTPEQMMLYRQHVHHATSYAKK